MEFKHVSIMLEECIEMLGCNPSGVYIDGTLGGGGHTEYVLEKTSPDGVSIGIDKDTEALEFAKQRLSRYGDRLITVHGDFMDMKDIIPKEYIGKVDGILLDLGVSSYQLDNFERGFSYMHNGKLDMRMDNTRGQSAYDVVNTYSKEKLTEIFYKYGEEKWSSRISDFIVKQRERKPIETTFELVDIIKAAIPAGARKNGPHPATRVFQAIRIEVNGELERLETSIESMVDLLKSGGRICIITFHSLEDRIVKQVFRRMENPCTCPPKAPICVCNKKPLGKVITKKPIVPKEDEIEMNPRARSSKLRVFEKQ